MSRKIRQEKYYGSGDILAIQHPFYITLGIVSVDKKLRLIVEYPPGAYAVYSNTLPFKVLRQIAGQLNNCRFCGDILYFFGHGGIFVNIKSRGHESVNRRAVDDGASILGG